MQEVVDDLEIDNSLIHNLWVVEKVAHVHLELLPGLPFLSTNWGTEHGW